MRKAFSLIELLGVLVILTMFSLVLTGLFRTLISELPRNERVLDSNTSVQHVLITLRKDIDRAVSLPLSYGELTAGADLVLIECPGGIVSYQLKKDEVVRRELNGNDDPNDLSEVTWKVPDANVRWQVWAKDGIGYALEISTSIDYKYMDRSERKWYNSHVFFAGIFSAVGKNS